MQGWNSCSVWTNLYQVNREEILEFYSSLEVSEDGLSAMVTVKKQKIHFDVKSLGELLKVPSWGYDKYVKQNWPDRTENLKFIRYLTGNTGETKLRNFKVTQLTRQACIAFHVITKCVIPRKKKKDESLKLDTILTYKLMNLEEINLPALIMKHMRYAS